MDKIAALVEKIADKLLGFFDFLELTFALAGLLSLSALLWVAWTWGRLPSEPGDVGVVVYLLGALGAYGLGLIGFAGGRWVRRSSPVSRLIGAGQVAEQRERLLAWAMEQRALGPAFPYTRFAGPEGRWLRDWSPEARLVLTNTLWAAARTEKAMEASMALLKSYWVRSAMYDGVAASLATWTVCLVLVRTGEYAEGTAPWVVAYPFASAVLIGSLCLAAWLSLREAANLELVQTGELVATVSWYLSGVAPSPLTAAAPVAGAAPAGAAPAPVAGAAPAGAAPAPVAGAAPAVAVQAAAPALSASAPGTSGGAAPTGGAPAAGGNAGGTPTGS